MKTVIWDDKTSFSKGENDRTPRVWECRAGLICIRVHRHRDYPGKWCISCFGIFGMEGNILAANNIEEAKKEAINLVIHRLRESLSDLSHKTVTVELSEEEIDSLIESLNLMPKDISKVLKFAHLFNKLEDAKYPSSGDLSHPEDLQPNS